ncbi:MAG: response regulator [Magnetococcales bacterium]|nr:response regulator [Magnetococcales bacterium]
MEKTFKNRILLIDDAPITGVLLRRYFQHEPEFELRHCTDALRSEQEIEQFNPHVVLLDLLMPERDGLDVLKNLRTRKKFRHLPVVILSSEEDPEQKARAFDLGANDYMVKLPDKAEVIARMAYHVSLYHNRQRRIKSEALEAQRRESAETISALLQTALEPLTLQEQLSVILDHILSIGWLRIQAKGAIFLMDEQKTRLLLAAQKGLAPELQTLCAQVNLGQCLCGRAALSRQLIFCHDVDERHETRFDGMQPHGHYCVPIMRQDQVLGVITLYLEPNHQSQKEERAFLIDVSRTIAGLLERKLVEKTLKLQAAAIDQAGDLVLITNAAGKIEYVNPAFEQISGYPFSQLKGKNPNILKSGYQDQRFYQQLWRTLKRGKVWQGRFVNKNKDNQLYDLETSISPIRDESDTITNYVAVSRDMTERVRLEKQLVQSQKMEAIGTLAGGIAHDFNNILGAITGYVELSQRKLDKEHPVFGHLKKVLRASKRARNLIAQLLTFSRHGEIGVQRVILAPLIKEVLKLLTAGAPENVRLVSTIVDGELTISADPTSIHQVLMNLCTNAFFAMKAQGGTLTVTLKQAIVDADDSLSDLSPGNYALLTVQDTGEGIPQEIQQRIFDPFFTTKNVGEGTGLGLSVVHGIVSHLNGRITVWSRAKKGTLFQVYLPLVTAENNSNTTIMEK